MRSVFAVVVSWVVLCGLWLLYVGSTTKEVLVAGAIAAALAAGVGVLLRRLGLLRYALDARWLARVWTLPWYVARDFALIALALRRGRPGGEWRTMEFPVGGDDPLSAGRRALVGEIGTISPNAYHVDFDRERGLLLMHVLDAKRAKGEPL